MIKAVLVDDEYYALQGLKMELDEIEGVEVTAMYEDGKRMLEEIDKTIPDVVFLDIEMPGINGLQLFEKILDTGQKPDIIFVTAYSHYAVKAFELNAVDYIVKPVTKDRLRKAIERIIPADVQNDKDRISINCFGHFAVSVKGQEINKGWRTRKAEELIAYLICQKGRFVSKEKIAEALWPELDCEKGISNLYLAYYYIKKQENKQKKIFPIESERGKMCLRVEEIDCDMLRFDALIEAWKNSCSEENVIFLETAVETYKGNLLGDVDYTWSLELQQSYEVTLKRLLKQLIEYYSDQKDVTKLKKYIDKLRKIQ